MKGFQGITVTVYFFVEVKKDKFCKWKNHKSSKTKLFKYHKSI